MFCISFFCKRDFGSICNANYLVVTWLRVHKQVSFSISVVYTSWTAFQQGALFQLSACQGCLGTLAQGSVLPRQAEGKYELIKWEPTTLR